MDSLVFRKANTPNRKSENRLERIPIQTIKLSSKKSKRRIYNYKLLLVNMRQIKPIYPSILFAVCLMTMNLYTKPSTQNKIGNLHMAQSLQSKYGLHGMLKAKEGKTDELISILLEAADLVSTAEGCHLYIVSKDNQDKSIIWVTEVWNSKEDHNNSLQIKGVKELISKAMPIIDGQLGKGSEFEVIGGAGL